jgi:membrane protein DedA with SNARE-associated domain
VRDFLEWLVALPSWARYATIMVAAGVENVVPPVPADTIVAFGAFVAARAQDGPWGVWVATMIGNLATAMGTYAAGRRYGAGPLMRRLGRNRAGAAEGRLRELFRRYGLGALFLSRFLPGVRALVPPFAGAMRIPAATVLAAMGTASGLWYGFITWVCYRVGADWDSLTARVGAWQRWSAIAAAALALGVGVVIWARRRRARGRANA